MNAAHPATGFDWAAPAAGTAEASGAPATGTLPPHRLSVVVPMYDERDNVGPLIRAVHDALDDHPYPWELIVVDDGSVDGTGPALVREAARPGRHLRVIRLSRNFRQTAAMQAGIDAARGDVIVTLDGDLQNDPRDIPRLVGRLLREDLDLVAGWRQQRQDRLWTRRLPSLLANRLIRQTTGLQFQDLGCSLKAMRASTLRRIRLYGEMHRFIPAWLATVTGPERMAEEPVAHAARVAGRSKYGLSRSVRVVVDLVAMRFFMQFGARPGHFFGAIGLGVMGLGGAILAWLLAQKLIGADVGGRPLLSLGFFLVIGGLQFLTTGVLAELLIRIYYGTGQAATYHRLDETPPADDGGWQRPPGDPR